MGKKYFKPAPVFNLTRNYSASLFTYFLKRGKTSDKNCVFFRNIKQNREHLKNITDGYKKFMSYAFAKFYSRDFKSKVAAHHTAQMKTFRHNVKKLIKSIEKLEKKQLKNPV